VDTIANSLVEGLFHILNILYEGDVLLLIVFQSNKNN
jgi:hypothetical protein